MFILILDIIGKRVP